MKRKLFASITSVSLPIFIQDTSSTTGGGLSGVVFNSAGIVAEYRRQGSSAWTAITLVTNTLGTYTSGGFIADGALAGAYELCVPDAAFAAGVRWVVIRVRGVTNMFPVLIEVELDAVNYQSATAFITGVNSLAPPTNWNLETINGSGQVDSSRVTGTVGAALSVSGTVGAALSVSGTVGAALSVTGNVGGNVVGSVGSVTGAVGSVTGTVGAALSVSGTVGTTLGIAVGGITSASFAAGSLTAAAIAAGALNGKGEWLPATLFAVKTPTAPNKIYVTALASNFADGQDVALSFVSGATNWYFVTGIIHNPIDGNGSWIDLNHSLYVTPTVGDTFYCVALNAVPLTSALTATATQTGMTAQGYTTARGPKMDNLDVAVSSRLASGSYTAAPTTNQIQSAILSSTNTIFTDALGRVKSLDSGGNVFVYTSPNSVANIASLSNLDVLVSSRLATTAYTAPLTALQTAAAVLDEPITSHVAALSTGLKISQISGSGGGGSNVNVIQWGGAAVGPMPGASSAGVGNVPINHNTGGANNLLMTLNSVPTAGIQIEAYLTSVYTAGNYGPATSLGQATSIADGTWKAPIMIAAPASGTIGVTLVISDAGKAPQATTTVTVSSAGTATTP